MVSQVSRQLFTAKFAQLEKKRRAAVSRPLTAKEITTLLSMRQNSQPIYESIEQFYSEEFKQRSSGTDGKVGEIPRYRPATQDEANLLYCDIHSREVND